MKFGILTFHSSINTGSVLQAYCVSKLLEKSFPESKVEIINLVPLNRELNELRFISLKPPFIKFHKISRYRSIRKFLKNRTNLSRRVYYRKLSSQMKYIIKQNYDYVITGSDTVWMHSEKLGGLIPTIYFLPEKIRAKKISVAASVDPLIDQNPYLLKKHILKSIFADYVTITVRDRITKELLSNLGVDNIINIADPTFLYDFESDLNIQLNKNPPKSKKKFLVWVSDQRLEQLIKKMLMSKLDVEFLPRDVHSGKCDDLIINDLNVYSNTDVLITDRFHRSIFALKLSNTLVINVERESKNPIPLSKGRDLFESMGIPECCIRFEKGKEAEFESKIVDLVMGYDEQSFFRRESLLQEYIFTNKLIWDSVISEIR